MSRTFRSPALTAVLFGVTALAAAGAQTRLDERTPFLLISHLATGNLALGWQAAESLRVRIRRLVPEHELYAISQDAINSVLESESPGQVWQLDDVRDIGKMLHADVILEIGATRVTGGIRLEPLLIRGRHTEPRCLDPIEAPTLGSAVGRLAPRLVADSSLRRKPAAIRRRPANER